MFNYRPSPSRISSHDILFFPNAQDPFDVAFDLARDGVIDELDVKCLALAIKRTVESNMDGYTDVFSLVSSDDSMCNSDYNYLICLKIDKNSARHVTRQMLFTE